MRTVLSLRVTTVTRTNPGKTGNQGATITKASILP